MRINKDTKKLFSVASRPGNFGATIYNQLFRLLGINAIYVPLGIDPKHPFGQIFRGLDMIGAYGINVSMPFKNDAKECVHNVPETANINTLTHNREGCWIGHNTDGHGFLSALQAKKPISEIETVYVFGTGAVAQTIVESFQCKYPHVMVTAGKEVPRHKVNLLVNATPVGMEGVAHEVPWPKFVAKSDCVFDVVISAPKLPTELAKEAQEQNKIFVPGQDMCMHGLVKQFLYHFPHQNKDDVQILVKEEMKVLGYEV